MTTMNRLTTSLLALAGLALIGQSAQALLPYSPGDVFIGINQHGGAEDYLVNLGSITYLTSNNQPLTWQLSASDISSVAPGWQNSDATYWGVVGTVGKLTGALGYAKGTTFVSGAAGMTPWYIQSNTAQLVGASAINNVINSTGDGYVWSTGTANQTSLGAAIVQSQAGSNSWATRVGTASGASLSFSEFGPTIESNFATGTANSVLDLYLVQPPNGSTINVGDMSILLGSFTIDDSALVTFTPVPEPTTFAMLGIGAGLLGLRRRRNA